MAERDMNRIRAGLMDPNEWRLTQKAAGRAFCGLAVTFLGLLCGWASGLLQWLLDGLFGPWL
jgi:hypothetical protein